MIFLQLFYTFLKIGLFSFGGGYGMLSVIQGEVVGKYGWLTSAEFTDIVAISQMTPGPIGINSATYVGFTAVLGAGYSESMAVLGAILASFSVMLPSFILMLLVCKFLMHYRKHPSVETIFSIIRPTVVGLLASAALLLMNSDNFGNYSTDPIHFLLSILFFLFAFVGVKVWKLSPILLIVICGAISGIVYTFIY